MKCCLVAPVLAALAIAGHAAQPESVKAAYDVYRDGLHVATVQEAYAKNGVRYHIVSESNPAGLLALFVRTKVKVQSSGAVTPAGLRPEQFEYGRLDDASKNVSAEFDWNAALLRTTFDGRNDTLPLAAGTQDRLSIMYQFMFLPAESSRELVFQMTNGKKIEPYRYQLAGSEQLVTPLGKFATLHFVKQREPGENGTEVWLAPEHNRFPVKLLILENDGSKFEQVITELEFR
jgi:hypothetical protein